MASEERGRDYTPFSETCRGGLRAAGKPQHRTFMP